MAGRKPHQAVQAFVGPLQQCLASVSRRAHLTVSPDGYTARARSTGRPHALVLNGSEPVRLPGPSGLGLELGVEYYVVEAEGEHGPWRTTTAGYRYTVTTGDGAEVLAWHWHPGGRSKVTRPHHHVGTSQLRPDGVLNTKHHVPGGRVALEDVLEHLVTDLGVTPERDDCLEVLARSREAFTRWRTWSAAPR